MDQKFGFLIKTFFYMIIIILFSITNTQKKYETKIKENDIQNNKISKDNKNINFINFY